MEKDQIGIKTENEDETNKLTKQMSNNYSGLTQVEMVIKKCIMEARMSFEF